MHNIQITSGISELQADALKRTDPINKFDINLNEKYNFAIAQFDTDEDAY